MRAAAPAAVLLAACVAGAQPSPIQGGETLLWVPRLTGAWTLDVGADSRLQPLGDGTEPPLPEANLALHVGYLDYLDGHGRLAWGGYLGGAFSLESDQQPRPADSLRLDLGLWIRARALSPDFVHGALGLFVEGGPLFLGEPLGPIGDQSDLAWRVAGGVEMGFGLLWYLSPYLFGEALFRVGAEATRVGGATHTTWIAGLRLNFEWAGRAGASAADEPDPPQPPPFDPFAEPEAP